MAIDIVDRFESVEIEHHHRAETVRFDLACEIGKGFQQAAAVGKSGQRIVLGKGQGFAMSRGPCLKLLAQPPCRPCAVSQAEDGDAQQKAGDHVERHLRLVELISGKKYWKDLNPSKNDKNYRK